MKFTKVYLDMDGVIADFELRYHELYKENPRDSRKNKDFGGNFRHFIDTKQFATLDMMPDAMELLTYLRGISVPIEILSSTAREEEHEAIAAQKRMWLQTHNIGYKANFVPGASKKYKFATPDSIIIDDTESVIDEWIKAGGKAIWHKNAKDTIKILQILGI